jgi:hypothetical protein
MSEDSSLSFLNMPKKVFKAISDDVDAGLHDDRLYDKALHPWRARLRRIMLPLIRTETPYLAAFQVLESPSSQLVHLHTLLTVHLLP